MWCFRIGSLYNWLSVEKNILFPVLAKRKNHEEELQKQLMEFLNKYSIRSLENILKKYPYEISGGEKQLVSIVRALFMNPELLVLDEPFSALDLKNREQMQQVLQQYWIDKKNITIMVSHDLDEALLLGERFLLVSGTPMRIINEWSLNGKRPRGMEQINKEKFIELRKDVIEKMLEKVGAD